MHQRKISKQQYQRKVSGSKAATQVRADLAQYNLRDQIGFLLRLVYQRHTATFISEMTSSLTQAQFGTLVTLYYEGRPCAHNEIGQSICLDAATIKGIVDRLEIRGMLESWTSPTDRRSRTVMLTAKGAKIVEEAIPQAKIITRKTLKPLSAAEQKTLLGLLKRLI